MKKCTTDLRLLDLQPDSMILHGQGKIKKKKNYLYPSIQRMCF